MTFQRPTCIQYRTQLIGSHIVATDPDEEAVEKGVQGLVFGQMVTSPNDHQSGQFAGFAAPAEDAFVEHHEQTVQDGTVGIE